VAVSIVDGLEAVEIGDHHRQGAPARFGALDQRVEMAVEIAAVVQAGQPVGDGHGDGFGDVGAQAVIVALAPHLGAQPGDQFLTVEGPHDIVVDAEFEGAGDALLLVAAGDQDDGHEPGTVERAQLRAQPQRVVAGKAGRHQDTIEIALRDLETGGLRVGLDDRGHVGRQQPGNGCRRIGVVVDQKHARALLVARHDIGKQRLDADRARRRRAQAQFVGQHFEPHQALDPGQKLEVVDRLGQKIVGAGLQTANAVGDLVERFAFVGQVEQRGGIASRQVAQARVVTSQARCPRSPSLRLGYPCPLGWTVI
jgi:hypothetical protein